MRSSGDFRTTVKKQVVPLSACGMMARFALPFDAKEGMFRIPNRIYRQILTGRGGQAAAVPVLPLKALSLLQPGRREIDHAVHFSVRALQCHARGTGDPVHRGVAGVEMQRKSTNGAFACSS